MGECVYGSGAGVNEDVQLIDDCLRGDSASFGLLVRKYQDRLYNTLCHVVGSREEAEDVAQEAFVQAFVKLASFQRNSAFYTWLYRIAFNTAVSRSRRKRPQRSVDAAREALGEEPMDTTEEVTERLLREERATQVRAALEELSEEHRSILVLREMEGLCYEEIAEVLELPVGTVRSRLHRARSQMRDQLKEVLGEYQP
jgi:RNA polymerase sigma-70 factor (ECF subfamily)